MNGNSIFGYTVQVSVRCCMIACPIECNKIICLKTELIRFFCMLRVQDVINLVVGDVGTEVQITFQADRGMPLVTTSPFQVGDLKSSSNICFNEATTAFM